MIASTLLQTGPGGAHGAGHGATLWWPLVVVLVLVALGVIVFLAVRDTDSRQPVSDLAILRRRYARGEIDEETFENRRRRLDDARR